jgi:hypothetical protein
MDWCYIDILVNVDYNIHVTIIIKVGMKNGERGVDKGDY